MNNPRDLLISSDILQIQNEYLQLSHEDTKEFRFQLLQMGFELSMINMVFCFYTIRNIEEAINYMSKIDNIWQHHYTNVDNKCVICGEKSNHFDQNITDTGLDEEKYRELNKSRISKSFSSDYDQRYSDGGNEDELCSVCYCNNIEKNFKLSLTCKHEFCLECWDKYVSEAIQCGKVLHIKCMDIKCKKELNEQDVLKIIGEKENDLIYEKYKKFLKRRQNEVAGASKQCPIRDCEGYGKKEENGTKYIKCEYGHKFCYDCLKPWHGSSTCEEIIDKDFFRWKKKKIIKKCPCCFFWTEKNEGCNHMTCSSCHFQWCWICEKKYSSTHYQNGSCAGLQFSNVVISNDSCCFCFYRGIRKIMYFYMVIGILILASMIGAPFLAGFFMFGCYLEDNNFEYIFTIIMIMATGILVSIIFQPIVATLSVVLIVLLLTASLVYPPFICYINEQLEEGI